MFLFVGLGNPGEKLKGTRHNIGRETLAEWQKKTDFADFEYDKKFNALVSRNKKAVLLLPETMMNKSGNAVKPALSALKTKPGDVVVLHDDADIELGRIKLSFEKRSAGHKGVESVKRALGTWGFWRLRIGIQPPIRASLAKGGKKRRLDAMKLVLQKFAPAEETALKRVKRKLWEGLSTLLKEGPERAMNEINR